MECKKNNAPINRKFSDIVEEFGDSFAGDVRLIALLEKGINISEAEQEDEMLGNYLKIDKIYNKLSNIKSEDTSSEYIKDRLDELKPINDYIEKKVEKAKKEFPENWTKLNEIDPEKEIEVIIFNFLNEYDTPETREVRETLKKEGLSETEKVIELHLPLKLGDDRITAESVAESLKILAKKIKSEYHEIEGITTRSWMLDHPKFKDLFSMKKIGESGHNWRQLIGSNGQLRQDRIKHLLSTGEMPYHNIIGYISTEDFLKKYLNKK